MVLWGAPFGGLLPEFVLLHSYCSFFFGSSPPGNLSGFSSYDYERVENSSLHRVCALSVDLLLLGSAPPVGLLLGGKFSADLLRWDAPPTVPVLGGAPPTGLLPGWEIPPLEYPWGALSKMLRPRSKCLVIGSLKGAPSLGVLPLGDGTVAAAVQAAVTACPRDTA